MEKLKCKINEELGCSVVRTQLDWPNSRQSRALRGTILKYGDEQAEILTKKLVKSVLPKSRRRRLAERPASYNRGSIIIFTVLMLAIILAITLTLTRIFIPRIRAITEATDSASAVYAADSAMEWCLYTNRDKPPLPQPIMSNGATYQIYNGGNPSNCTSGEVLNYRTVGTYRGVSRSFEVSEL